MVSLFYSVTEVARRWHEGGTGLPRMYVPGRHAWYFISVSVCA